MYIYLCDFAKRCPLSFRLNTGITRVQASVPEKKNRELGVLLGVSREPRPRPIRGWVADLFCVRTRGVVRGEFVTLPLEPAKTRPISNFPESRNAFPRYNQLS